MLWRDLDVQTPEQVKMERQIEAAVAARSQVVTWMKPGAHPDRVDLVDKHCRMARDEGVLLAIASDAHDTGEFTHLRYGVGQARRAWLGRDDVLNARALRELLPLLERDRARPKARSRVRAGEGN